MEHAATCVQNLPENAKLFLFSGKNLQHWMSAAEYETQNCYKLQSFNNEIWCLRVLFSRPDCAKTHPHESIISKIFLGVIPPIRIINGRGRKEGKKGRELRGGGRGKGREAGGKEICNFKHFSGVILRRSPL
jgi:hypothetical protein